jgi:hypothetical protein
MIDLRCQDVTAMLAGLPDGCAALLHFDPPWTYDQTAVQGNAADQYDCLPVATIADHIAASYRVAAADAYLAIWCTFPKLAEWLQGDGAVRKAGWQYVSGAAWGKSNGQGPGFHFTGDAELLLLYKKGHARPYGGPGTNYWDGRRIGHSEKPQIALQSLARIIPPGALVVEGYAGASASMARACRALGRRYVGAEIDEKRWNRAMLRLSQREMDLIGA